MFPHCYQFLLLMPFHPLSHPFHSHHLAHRQWIKLFPAPEIQIQIVPMVLYRDLVRPTFCFSSFAMNQIYSVQPILGSILTENLKILTKKLFSLNFCF